MDGYELVRRLREDEVVCDTKVIFYTAIYREGEAEILIQQCGITDLIFKPCEPEEMLKKVAKALNPAYQQNAVFDVGGFRDEHLRVITNKLSEKSDELEKNNLKLTALIEIGLELSKERDPIHLLEKYNREARGIIGAKYWLHDKGRSEMVWRQ